jgi:hypothetical protein
MKDTIIHGEQACCTGFLVDSEGKLGRSTIIDLSEPYGKGFKQVDHRSIEFLIIKNVKYTVK